MKWFFQIFVFLIPVLVSGQRKISSVVNSEIVINYPDSTVKASIFLKNTKLNPKQNLTYYWYTPDKINKNMGGYSGRLLDGTYKVFDLDKNLIAEGTYKKGLKHGTWKRWNIKGGLQYLYCFNKGVKQGKELIFDRSGKLVFTCNYRHGLKHGKSLILTNDTLTTQYFKKDMKVNKKRFVKRLYAKIFSKNKKNEKEENKKDVVKEIPTNQKEVIIDKEERKVEIPVSDDKTENVKKKVRPNKVKNKNTDQKKPEINND